MNMQGLLKQAQKMQKELTKLEDELNEKVYETTMGGGVIKVEVKGSMSVESISIDESLLEKDNKEDLEDMLKSALNDAFAKAVEDKEKYESNYRRSENARWLLMYPKKFEALVECYRRLPGVGIKTAERYAFQTLEWDDETMDSWIHAFQNAKEGLKKMRGMRQLIGR